MPNLRSKYHSYNVRINGLVGNIAHGLKGNFGDGLRGRFVDNCADRMEKHADEMVAYHANRISTFPQAIVGRDVRRS